MNIFEKIDKLNHLYSYNIFAFNGFTILLTRFYLLYYYNSYTLKYGQGSWLTAMSWLMLIFECIIYIIFITAFIVWLFEFVFNFKINNTILIKNKIINIIRYVGTTISLTYLVYGITMLIYVLLVQSLLPNDLIYYDIYSK